MKRFFSLILFIFACFFSGCRSVPQVENEAVASSVEIYENVKMELPADAELSDLVKKALAENAGVQAAFYNWKGAIARARGAGVMPDPKFSFGYFVEEVETRVGPQEYRVSLAQTFPWFGKLDLRQDQAVIASKAVGEEFFSKRNSVVLEVRRTYAELFFINKSIYYVDENIKLLEKIIKVVDERVATATAGMADMLRLNVELEVQLDRKASLVDMKEALEQKLLSLVQVDSLPNLKEITELPLIISGDGKFAELEKSLLANNPSLKALDYLVKKSEITVELSRKETWPDITLGVDYVGTDHAEMPGVSDSGKDPVMVMVSFNLPIWQSRYDALKKEREAELKLAEMSLADRRNTLKALLADFVASYQRSNRTLNLLRERVVTKQRRLVAIIETDYINNKVSYLDLIQAIRKLLIFELQVREAELRRFRAMAGILYLTER